MADPDAIRGAFGGTAPAARWAIAAGALALALLLAAAIALWARYGTAVFFEMIAAGIAACF